MICQFIFFDLGWTLEDETLSQWDRARKAADAAWQYGIATTAERILELQEEGARLQVREVFPYALSAIGLDEEQTASVMKTATWDKSLLSLYPETIPLLDSLKQKHYLGIIANQSPGTEARLQRYGIHSCFDLLFASAEMGIAKPDPRIFDLACERAGCKPKQAWMIGDRIDNDIRPAKEAGWGTIRILQGYNSKQTPRDESEIADYSVDSLAQIAGIFP